MPRGTPTATSAAESQGPHRDAANAILTAVGYTFRLVLAWLRQLLLSILVTLLTTTNQRSNQFLNGRLFAMTVTQPRMLWSPSVTTT